MFSFSFVISWDKFSIRFVLAYPAIIIMVYEIERGYWFNINNLYFNWNPRMDRKKAFILLLKSPVLCCLWNIVIFAQRPLLNINTYYFHSCFQLESIKWILLLLSEFQFKSLTNYIIFINSFFKVHKYVFPQNLIKLIKLLLSNMYEHTRIPYCPELETNEKFV